MEAILFWVFLVTLGYVFGKRAEKNHYRSIIEREKTLLALPATSSKFPLSATSRIGRAHLVTGSVVISIDYFKRVLAGLRTLIGGPMQSYETLLDRARREAVLRLKESCPGADEIINLRLDTASISNSTQKSIGSIEVLASGTAIYYVAKI